MRQFAPRISRDQSIARLGQRFCNIMVNVSLRRVYHVTKAAQSVNVTDCGWQNNGSWCADTSHTMFDLKAAQMNVQHSPVQEFMSFEFERLKQPKISAVKNGKDAVDLSNQIVQEFFSGYKKPRNQVIQLMFGKGFIHGSNRTKQCTYTKLNCLLCNCLLTLKLCTYA